MRKTYKERVEELRQDPARRARMDKATTEIVISNRLSKARERAGLNQSELADRLGITQSRVSRLESAEDLKLSTLIGYADAVGAELRIELLHGKQKVSLVGPRRKRATSTEDVRIVR